MPLHAISEDSTVLSYHCDNPKCKYHNCANWEAHRRCASHDTIEYALIPADVIREQLAGVLPADQLAQITDKFIEQQTSTNRIEGETRQIPVDHPEIKWVSPTWVAMPKCECGPQLFFPVVFTQEELESPNFQIVERDPANPRLITKLTPHPAIACHQQLAAKLISMGKVYTPPQNETSLPASQFKWNLNNGGQVDTADQPGDTGTT